MVEAETAFAGDGKEGEDRSSIKLLILLSAFVNIFDSQALVLEMEATPLSGDKEARLNF